jgi:hypothetical protein
LWAGSLRAPPQLVIAGFLKTAVVDFMAWCVQGDLWGKKNLSPIYSQLLDCSRAQEPHGIGQRHEQWGHCCYSDLIISSYEKRFWESFCVHAPHLVVRSVTLEICGWALCGLLRNLSLPNSSKTQISILYKVHVQLR